MSAPRHLELTACRVDLHGGVVERPNGSTEPLTSSEARLLVFLASHPDAAHSREDLLRRVWGYAPRVMSRTVEVTVRRLRQKIEADPSDPVHLITDRGSGYRFRVRGGRFSAPESADGARNLAGASLAETNLVHRPGAFVGRQALLSSLVEGAGVCVLVGPPGVGKTRLAEVAGLAAAAAGAPGGAWRVQVEPGPVERLARAIADTLGTTPEDLPWRLQRGAWIVLDAAEVSVGAVSAFLERMGPGPVRWVVTSRERLPSPFVHVELGGLPTEEGVAPLSDQLDGLPLALELAAPRLRVMSAAAIVATLQRHLEVLGSGLIASLAASWERLDQAHRRVLAQATVFAAPFSLRDAAAVLDPGGRAWVLEVLQSLCDRSLLTRVRPAQSAGAWRFGLLAVVRAFVVDQAERDRTLLDGAVRRHAEHVADKLTPGELRPDPGDRPYDVVEATHVARVALAAGWSDLAVRAWTLGARTGHGVAAAGPLLELAREIDALPPERALAVDFTVAWAQLALGCSDPEQALALAERSAKLAGGEPGPTGRAALITSESSFAVGDLPRARSAAIAAERAFEEAGLANGVRYAQRALSLVLHAEGRLIESHALSAALAEALTPRGYALVDLAADEIALGWPGRAVDTLRQALDEVPADLGAVRAVLLHELGEAHWALEELEVARARYTEALAVARAVGRAESCAWNELALGRLDLVAGDLAACRAHLDAAALGVRSPRARARLLALRAEERAASGAVTAAATLADEALALALRHPDATTTAAIQAHIGMVRVHAGDLDDADRIADLLDRDLQRFGVGPASPLGRALARLRAAIATGRSASTPSR